MSKVIVSGSLAYDRIMDYPGLFAEHVLPEKANSINLSFNVDKLSVEFGGTAGNIAYNLALLGEQPEIISSAGQDFGAYKSHLLLVGINASTVRLLEGVLTSSAFVFTDKEDNQISAFYPGAGGSAYDTPVNVDGRALAMVSAGCVQDMVDLPQQYKRQNLKYFFDPGHQIDGLTPGQLRDGISGAQALFGSDYEIGLIAQKTGWTEDAILEHVPVLVVTYGSKGVRIRTRDADAQVAAVTPEQLVDPTGAGDAFRAGFIKGIIAGFPLDVCAKLGCVVASFKSEKHGTQNHTFTFDQLKSRYKSAYKEDLKL